MPPHAAARRRMPPLCANPPRPWSTPRRSFASVCASSVARRAAAQGGSDLYNSDVLPHNRVAAPRSAAS
eukprot:1968975-Prymnesium_polylepis.1